MVKIFNSKLKKNIYIIYQGDIFIGYHGEIVSTVLGSCIAICIFDLKRRVGGMNHILLPYKEDDRGLKDGYYCDLSIKNMVESFLEDGSSTKDLRAKIFGGADISKSDRIGCRNVKCAIKILKSYNIKILAKDVGGKVSRKVYFKTGNNRAFIKYEDVV